MFYCKKYTCCATREKDAMMQASNPETMAHLEQCKCVCSKNGILYGRVRNLSGQPVEHAIVKLVSECYEPVLMTQTDCCGNYFFFTVPPNRSYRLLATAEAYRLSDDIKLYLKEWDVRKADIFLRCSTCEDAGVLTGTVRSKVSALPLAQAQVTLYEETCGGAHLKSTTQTNEFGQFALTRLPPGAYLVQINLCGYIGAQYRVRISVCGQMQDRVTLLCPDSSKLEGTVSGVITDSEQQPIADADVILFRQESDHKMTPIAVTKTNANGVYLFIHVKVGFYQVAAKG